MAEDLERQVSEGLLGALDPLAGVGFGKSNTQRLSHSLRPARFLRLGNFGFGGFGEGLEVLDAILEVGIIDTGLEAELVQDGASEGNDEIESRTATWLVLFSKKDNDYVSPTLWRASLPFRDRPVAQQHVPNRLWRSSG